MTSVTLELLDSGNFGSIQQPVCQRLILKCDASELLPAIHIPGPHTDPDFPGLGVPVIVVAHAPQYSRRRYKKQEKT